MYHVGGVTGKIHSMAVSIHPSTVSSTAYPQSGRWGSSSSRELSWVCPRVSSQWDMQGDALEASALDAQTT